MERYRFSSAEQALMENMQMPFAVFQFVDRRIVTLVVSDGFCELFGAVERDRAYAAMDHDAFSNVHPDDVARIGESVYRFMREGGKFETIYRLKKRNAAGYSVIHAFGKHIYAPTGERLAQVWYADEGDFTEDKEIRGFELSQALSNALHEESILRASYYDYLTGLPSMSHFFELAEAGKAAILREGSQPALLFMDLSGMKYYNHKNSFAEGDKLLRAFAGVLSRTFGVENCCHIGADHFAVLAREADVEATLPRLFKTCEALNGGRSLPVRVGIYPARLEDVPVSTACDRAKYACDAMRKVHASGYNWYDARLRDDMEKRQYILDNLDRAMEERWIQVHFQPIVRAVTEKVCDEEALARWIDPVRGFLSPADFIPYLEEARLIYKLDLYMLDRVLEIIGEKKARGLHIVPHSINLSRSDFDACDIVEEIRSRVDAAGVSRDRITIEITESVIGSDFEFMKTQVERFQSLGFPVWMDDFGSEYSSLEVLQSIKFNLLKFDMGFMRKLEEGDSGRIILTELMKMATSLGVDTICEGVETEKQVQFLREIGCSKLQGYYYCKPISFESLLERYETGRQLGFENPAESAYYEAIGRVNLYDLAVIANEDRDAFQNFFNTIPMGIMEILDGRVSFVRTNHSYREFMRRFFSFELAKQADGYPAAPFGPGSEFMKLVQECCNSGGRAFFDEPMPDGSVVHAFARRISVNPVTGTSAAAIAVLSISEPGEGETYADIARALAADYYRIYVVELDTERYIEYSSPMGGEELAVERHGEHFFETARRDAVTRIYHEDREAFLDQFDKAQILREMDESGAFTAAYRLVDTGAPMTAAIRATRIHPGANRIIIGINVAEGEQRPREPVAQAQRTMTADGHIADQSGKYYAVYVVDSDTSAYSEYSATEDYGALGFEKRGDDFFETSRENARRVVCLEDLPWFLSQFTREKMLRDVRENGFYSLHYRLMVKDAPRPVVLRAAMIREDDGERLIVGVHIEDVGENGGEREIEKPTDGKGANHVQDSAD